MRRNDIIGGIFCTAVILLVVGTTTLFIFWKNGWFMSINETQAGLKIGEDTMIKEDKKEIIGTMEVDKREHFQGILEIMTGNERLLSTIGVLVALMLGPTATIFCFKYKMTNGNNNTGANGKERETYRHNRDNDKLEDAEDFLPDVGNLEDK